MNTLHFVDTGKGTPHIFLHGYPFDHRMWSPQIEPLSTRCRVIALDLPGFGKSKPYGNICTMKNMADSVLQLIHTLELDRVVLCGLSMGGYVALEFFRNYPEKVAGLILADTKASADSEGAKTARKIQSEKILSSGMASIVEALLPKLITPENFAHKTSVYKELSEMMLACPPEGASAAALGMAQRIDQTPHLKNIHVPVSIMVGEHDTLTPLADATLMKNEIKAAKLHIVPQSAHVSNLENPEYFNKIISGRI